MSARNSAGKDYYDILGLQPDATEEEIRKAYRRLAFQCHPDRNPGDSAATERFKEISEAYAALIDPAKRLQYDQSRQAGRETGFQYSRDDLFREMFTNPAASAVFDDLAREFERMGMRVDRRYFHETLFGGRTVVSGGIFIVSPFAPLLTAFRLARKMVQGPIRTSVPHSRAHDSLRNPGIMTGIAQFKRWLLGLTSGAHRVARAVAGAEDLVVPLSLTGAEAEHGGSKRVTVRVGGCAEDLLVTIPPGVKTGTRLRLRGKGPVRRGGSRGDLYLSLDVTD